MRIHALILLLYLVGVASAVLPSDLIQTAPHPGQIELSGTIAASVKNIDALNEPLGMWTGFEVPNIGHFCSWTLRIDQDQEKPVGVPDKLLNFSEQIPMNLTSVGKTDSDFVPLSSNTNTVTPVIPVY